MDKFRTIVDIPTSALKIDYITPCFLSGSCFTEYIGEKMESAKLPVIYNPSGVLYNPSSISINLRMLMSGRVYDKSYLELRDGLWISPDHHTSFSDTDSDRVLESINRSVREASAFLRRCKVLLLTFGTSWVYVYNKSNRVAANCHKIPQREFTRKLLSHEEIISDYGELINELKNFNPEISIIFTVSPVRHFKDGAFNNQVSKSTLFLAVNELLKGFDNTYYFPSYEIFMDELRDYRFYADDMLHPSQQGIAYVWERFCDTYINTENVIIISAVEKLKRAVAHRPFRTNTPAWIKFIDATLKQMEELELKHPFLDFSNEKLILQSR